MAVTNKTMKCVLHMVCMVLMLTAVAFGQKQVSSIPRPFIYAGPELGDSAALVLGGGVMENTTHFLFSGEASRDNDGKSNDNVNVDTRGHNDRFQGAAYIRTTSGWFFGGGAHWSRLYTKAYTKEQWHPTVGFGNDILWGPQFSARIQMDYILPQGAEHTSASGCTVPKGQCGSGVQGPEFSIFIPNPVLKGHFFARFLIATLIAHDTITSTDPALTKIQTGHHFGFPESQFTFMFRF